MVRFSLGGAHRCGCGWAGPFHQPQGLEGVVIQALLREKALCRVQQQQVLTHEKNRKGAPECTRQPEHPDSKQAKTLLKLRLLPLSNAPQDRYRELTSNITITTQPVKTHEDHKKNIKTQRLFFGINTILLASPMLVISKESVKITA